MTSDFVDPREAHLPEIDLALVHALQVDARAPWSRIAHAIGIDAATVARRWAAIAESGAAWFTVWPTPERHAAVSDAALILVSGALTPADERDWCALPWVLTVERTSRGLMALAVGHGGINALDARIAGAFRRPGLDVMVEYAAHVAKEDSTWRLRALSARQVAQIQSVPNLASDRPRPAREEVIEEVTALLREDARMSLGTIAKQLGVSDATARRTVERLVGQGLVRVGCDVAMSRVGLGRGAVLRVNGLARPSREKADVICEHPSVHRVICTVGPVQATVSVRVGALTDIDDVEAQWPGLHVVDRWTITAALKRNGHLLGPDGRSVGHVDVDW